MILPWEGFHLEQYCCSRRIQQSSGRINMEGQRSVRKKAKFNQSLLCSWWVPCFRMTHDISVNKMYSIPIHQIHQLSKMNSAPVKMSDIGQFQHAVRIWGTIDLVNCWNVIWTYSLSLEVLKNSQEFILGGFLKKYQKWEIL